MPRKTQKGMSRGIKKMLHEYEKSGTMKTTRATYRPRSKKAAIKQAVAIGYNKARAKGRKVPARSH